MANTNNKTIQIMNNETAFTSNMTNSVVVGVLSYAYLNDMKPSLFEEKEFANSNIASAAFNQSKIKSYHYQRYPTSQEQTSVFRYMPTVFNYSSDTRFSFYSLPRIIRTHQYNSNYTIFGFLKSSYSRKENRQMIRKTFLNFETIPELKDKVKIFFIIGHNGDSTAINTLLEEQEQYNDLVITNVVDTYQNLTIKTMMAEDLFISLNITSEYYMSIDDDVCVDFRRIISILPTFPKTKFYGGSILKAIPSDDPMGVHGVSSKLLPNPIHFAVGPAYIISKDVIECHIKKLKEMKGLFHVDDAFIGYISSLCEAFPKSIPRWMGRGQSMVGHSMKFSSREYCTAHSLKKHQELYEVCSSVYK
ncbi:hypothetical protein WA158_004800 [Blastocystis sp. Blastoise]